MILKTWVGPDGLVRWSRDDPDAHGYVRDDSAGVVHAKDHFTVFADPHAPFAAMFDVPVLDVALRLAFDTSMWEDT